MFNQILISKRNLINNINILKIKNQNSKICAMVKANAYGVGLKQVVKTIDEYVDYYGVSNLSEAKTVKKYTNKNILIVGPLCKNNVCTNFSYACSSIDDVKFLANLNKKINIHLKINSGMNRYGIKTRQEFLKILQIINKSKLTFEGIFTHFATVDEFVDMQNEVFKQFVKIANDLGFQPIVHADNSFVNEKFNHKYDMVRIGFNLYNNHKNGFKSVVKIKSEVVQINKVKNGELVGYSKRFVANKQMKVAVVPVGYADGFDMKNIGIKLNIGGHLCKVLNICMDCFMVDVSNVKIKKGDEIFLLDNFNSLTKYAKYLNTSEYEVMTKFSHMRANRKLII